ncbi:MAG: hypothetical protein IKR92_06540 [Alphaproteobacteria bacterium]|nr:hypothetical protein [Alphaproteobacteria bacterium]
MRKLILTLSLATTLLFCAKSMAQLDLENIMQSDETAKPAENTPPTEDVKKAETTDSEVKADAPQAETEEKAEEAKSETADEAKVDEAEPKAEETAAESAETAPEEAEPTEDAEEQVTLPEDEESEEPAEEAAESSAEADEIVLPEDEPDDTETPEEDPTEEPQATDTNTQETTDESDIPTDEDNFMVQYFNDVDAAAAEDAANQAARDAATELIRDEPTMVAIPEEQMRLLKIGEKRRQQREEKRRQEIEEQKRIEAEIQAQKEAEEKAKAEAQAAEAEARAAKDPKVIAARKAEAEKQRKEQLVSGHEKAPFGLYWGLTKEQAESLGFQFKPATLENYQNVYALVNPKQQQKQFDPIFVIFGDRDHLHTVYAEGVFAKDTPKAEKVLRIYDQYYTALKKKYGNEKEYFKPNKHEETIEAPAAVKQTADDAEIKGKAKTVTVEHPRGNDDFLKELQEEKASLYAVFGNQKVKVTLSVEVNEEGQSRIVLDYENLKTQQSDSKDTLSDLINDL